MTSKIIQLLSDHHGPNLYIVDKILFNVEIAGNFALHATCRHLRWLVCHMTNSPYLLKIDEHLQMFSNDPTRFRYELGKCDGLITGSFVQNFLAFGIPASPRLVVFVDSGGKSAAFMGYLQKDEGYGDFTEELHGYSAHRKYFNANIFIQTTSSPIVDVINKALTSVDLMFISWNKVYCLFPLPTIKRHRFFTLNPFDDDMGITLRKYSAAGWTTRDLVWPDEAPELFPQEGVQQIGGEGSLIIDLGNSSRGEFTPDYVLKNSTFSIVRAEDDLFGQPHLDVSATLLPKEPALRYTYITGCQGMAQVSWRRFLTTKLRQWKYLEIIKMHPSSRPHCFILGQGFLCSSHCIIGRMTSTWDYADDHISTWFREWRKQETIMALLPPTSDCGAAHLDSESSRLIHL